MLEALNLKNNAETRYRCQVSVYRTIGPLVLRILATCFVMFVYKLGQVIYNEFFNQYSHRGCNKCFSLFFFFIQFNVPFKIISLIETS